MFTKKQTTKKKLTRNPEMVHSSLGLEIPDSYHLFNTLILTSIKISLDNLKVICVKFGSEMFEETFELLAKSQKIT